MITRPRENVFPAVEALPRWRIDTQRYLRMVEAGVLGPEDRVELIDGMIVPMSPAGPKHNHVVMRFTELFAPAMPRIKVSVQGTLVLAEGQVFDPDFMLLQAKQGGYKDALPTAADVLLIVEAADTSLARDRQVKLPLYAAAGIAEYWIADLDRDALIVHREPDGQGYGQVRTYRGEEAVSPLALPEMSVRAGEVFA